MDFLTQCARLTPSSHTVLSIVEFPFKFSVILTKIPGKTAKVNVYVCMFLATAVILVQTLGAGGANPPVGGH